MIKNQGERWWNKVEQRHDRSGIGNLIRPEDIYTSPWDLLDSLRRFGGADLDQLGAVDILDGDNSLAIGGRVPHAPDSELLSPSRISTAPSWSKSAPAAPWRGIEQIPRRGVDVFGPDEVADAGTVVALLDFVPPALALILDHRGLFDEDARVATEEVEEQSGAAGDGREELPAGKTVASPMRGSVDPTSLMKPIEDGAPSFSSVSR